MDGTKIQKSWLGTKNQDLVVGIEIQDPLTRTKKFEDKIGTENMLPTKNSLESKIRNQR